MSEPQQQRPHQINVSLDEKVAEGIYSNLALISHSPAEFFIDFARMVPGTPKANVHARIIMTPSHCKFLLNALKSPFERIGLGAIHADSQYLAALCLQFIA